MTTDERTQFRHPAVETVEESRFLLVVDDAGWREQDDEFPLPALTGGGQFRDVAGIVGVPIEGRGRLRRRLAAHTQRS